MRSFNNWVRDWLWGWAGLLALVIIFGWIFGSFSTGWKIVSWSAVVLTVVCLVGLTLAGLVELRKRRNDNR